MYCLIEDMRNKKSIKDIKVVDNTTLKFIPVDKAWYVVGSSKPATMVAKTSKYALGTKEAAEKFSEKFGGKIKRFKKALKLAQSNFENDTKAKKLRQAKAAKKGAVIYKKVCKPINKKFKSVSEAKEYKESGICRDIKRKPLQALGLYLLNVK